MEEIWYEATNETTKEIKSYATFEDLKPNFMRISRYDWGKAVQSLDFYTIEKCRIEKEGLFKSLTYKDDIDRPGRCVFVKTEDLKNLTKDWRAPSSTTECLLIRNISNSNNEIFKNWVLVEDKDGYYKMIASPEDINLAEQLLTQTLQPFVIKGSDWPYWFKVNNELISSTTSNWFKHMYDCYKVLSPNWLEEYNGEDKEKEHTSKDNQ